MSDKNSSQTNHNIKLLGTETWKDELIQKLRQLELVANDASLNSIDKLRQKLSSEINELLKWVKEKTQPTNPLVPKSAIQWKSGTARNSSPRRLGVVYGSANTSQTPPTSKKKRSEHTYVSMPNTPTNEKKNNNQNTQEEAKKS